MAEKCYADMTPQEKIISNRGLAAHILFVFETDIREALKQAQSPQQNRNNLRPDEDATEKQNDACGCSDLGHGIFEHGNSSG
jgi:hypothetical protein